MVVVCLLFLFPVSVCLVNTGLPFKITGSFDVNLTKGINFLFTSSLCTVRSTCMSINSLYFTEKIDFVQRTFFLGT